MSESNMQERIEKTKSILKEELNTVRAGRANPTLLDKIMVDYYGTPTPLKNLSTGDGAVSARFAILQQ